jgi:hypothetical protein
MPFTPAHTAIVIPFLRSRHVSATALLIGAMAPDFEYFLKMSVDGVHGHTVGGLLYFDLPVTIALSFGFHLIVKKNLITSLPGFLQRRFAEALLFDFANGFKVRPFIFVLSAIAGSATHVIWDGFTHGNGFFVGRFSFYDGAYFPFQGVDYPLWYALQYISTFTGLFVIIVAIAFKRPTDLSPIRVSTTYWFTFVAVTAAVVGIRFLIYSADYNLGNLVVCSITGICIALIVCGFLKIDPVQISK